MNGSAMTARLRKGRLSFSLRNLLVVVTVAGVLLGWKVREVNRRMRVVEWVRTVGGFVTYNYEYDENNKWIPNADPPGPTWLRNLIGVDYLAKVTRINLSNSRVTDLSPLAEITTLESLSLCGTPVVDLTPLRELTSLRTLNATRTQVADLSPLAKLTNLETLDLSGTSVTDAAPLVGFLNLKRLGLNYTAITDVSPLTNLANLDILQLRGVYRDLQSDDVMGIEWDDVNSTDELLERVPYYRPSIPADEFAELRKALPGCDIECAVRHNQ